MDEVPLELVYAVGCVVEVGFAGTAPPDGAFGGQDLYLEWGSDRLLNGFVIPAQDLKFITRAPTPPSAGR